MVRPPGSHPGGRTHRHIRADTVCFGGNPERAALRIPSMDTSRAMVPGGASTSSHRRRRHLAAVVTAAVVGTGMLTGCGDESSPSSAPQPSSSPPTASDQPASLRANESDGPSQGPGESTPAEHVVITISDFAYDVPDSIAPGTEITVVNKDSVPHTVTAKGGGPFDAMVDAGSKATFSAPEQAGDYAFYCTIHPQMTATLVVG